MRFTTKQALRVVILIGCVFLANLQAEARNIDYLPKELEGIWSVLAVEDPKTKKFNKLDPPENLTRVKRSVFINGDQKLVPDQIQEAVKDGALGYLMYFWKDKRIYTLVKLRKGTYVFSITKFAENDENDEIDSVILLKAIVEIVK